MRNPISLAVLVLILCSLSPAADTKIKTRNTAMGYSSESTVYIKGARERSEGSAMGIGPSMVTIMQCDQKRIITVNPQTNICMVTLLGGDEAGSAAASASEPARKGGTVTLNINTVDTGERQKIFGLTARHVKSTTNMESSPDACSKGSMHMESDGWYADIAPALTCSMGGVSPAARPGGRAGCQDTFHFKRTGAGHPGYPLKQTTTMQAEGHTITMSSEVVELTTTPLDASLFEMPAGCKVVSSYQELMGTGGMMAGMTGGMRGLSPTPSAPPGPSPAPEPTAPPSAAPPAAPAPPTPAVAPKGSGVVRVGVVKINDASGEYLPIDNLRVNLMSEITLRQMEAVPLDAEGTQAIAAEAADKQCDYILYTDATQVKAPGTALALPVALKGVSLSKDKYQALLAMTLYRAGRPAPELKQSPLAADGDQFGVNAVMAAFEREAEKVAEQVKKDSGASKPAKPAPAKKPASPKKPG
jgi:hypothetical protein